MVPEFCNQVIDTTGLCIEKAYKVDLDPEVEALLKMSKRKNPSQKNGPGSPTKAPRTQGIHQLSINQTPYLTRYFFTDESTGEAEFFDLDDTVLNDGSGSSHDMSTEDTKTQQDAQQGGFFYQDNGSGTGTIQLKKTAPSTKDYIRQFLPLDNQGYRSPKADSVADTPSSHQATPGDLTPEEQAGTPGMSGDMALLGTGPPVLTQVQIDLQNVRKAVEQAGGLVSQKPPDLEKMKARVGQDLEILNEVLDIGEQVIAPERPDEQTLHKLTNKDLLPPSSTAPVPIEYEHDPSDYDFVQERRVEFLVMMKPRTVPSTAVLFLTQEQLQTLFDHIRNKIDDVQIMETVLWTRVEKGTEISSIMLSTINYPLFNAVRHHIRAYTHIEGFRVETYEKAEFVKKYGLTMYIPRDNANLCPAKLIRALMFKYPELYTKDITILSRATFTSDPPDKDPAKRSRIGDRIFLFDSPSLAEKLRPFPEDKKFFLNRGFSVTIKGGHRGNSVTDLFSHTVTSTIIKSAAGEAMAKPQKAAG